MADLHINPNEIKPTEVSRFVKLADIDTLTDEEKKRLSPFVYIQDGEYVRALNTVPYNPPFGISLGKGKVLVQGVYAAIEAPNKPYDMPRKRGLWACFKAWVQSL